MYKVEKNIAMPEETKYISKNCPYSTMEVGDSFFVPDITYKQVITIKSRIYRLHKEATNMKRYTVKQMSGGLRVWRIE